MATLISMALGRLETLSKVPSAALLAAHGAATPELERRILQALQDRKQMRKAAKQLNALRAKKRRCARKGKTQSEPRANNRPEQARAVPGPTRVPPPACKAEQSASNRQPCFTGSTRDPKIGDGLLRQHQFTQDSFVQHDEYGLGKIIAQHGPDAIVMFKHCGEKIINRFLLHLHAKPVLKKPNDGASWSVPPSHVESYTPLVSFSNAIYRSFTRCGRLA